MKKLMVAFAAVAMAISAQAVAYDWSATDVCSGFYADGREENAAGTAYLYFGTADEYSSMVSAISQGLFIKNNLGDDSFAEASFNGGVVSTYGDASSADYAGQKAWVVFIADTVNAYEGGSKLASVDPVQGYITSAKTVATASSYGNTEIAFGSLYDTSSLASNWTAQPEGVPEPTSGLLLLLGMAGLALRRRRA